MARIQVKSLYKDFTLSPKHFLFFIVFLKYSLAQHGTSFFICHPNQALSETKFIKVFRVIRQLECAHACTRDTRCKSFNFGAGQDRVGKYTCQLLAVDMREKSLTASKKLHHYEMFYPEPCNSTPCQNGGKCTEAIGTREIKCGCRLGFTGNRCQTINWVKFNSIPKCFGAKNDHYAAFDIPKSGWIVTMRLVHLSGELNCDAANPNGWNYWGCYDNHGDFKFMSVIITDDKLNYVKLPDSGFVGSSNAKVWSMNGFNGRSKELVFPILKSPLPVVKGEQYRIWFGEDLDNKDDTDNAGIVCVDVYGLYVSVM